MDKFQLTRLMRGVTFPDFPVNLNYTFQLTRLMRGVTIKQRSYFVNKNISTHTPHARRDAELEQHGQNILDFNSHASCEA